MKIAHKLANMFQTYSFLKKASFPKQVKIVEVGPRDGLQNEKEILSTEFKVNLINNLALAGLQTIEVTSFVSPKWVPQMADSKEVYKNINKQDNVSYPVLVPNTKGMQSAIDLGVKEIAIFGAASESFSKKNINCSIDESLDRFKDVVMLAKDHSIKVRGYISCVMGCPYEGEVNLNKVNEVVNKLFDMGCYEVSLGDTIGKGNPDLTNKLLNNLTADKSKLAAHYHNTYDRAIENIIISLANGITVFDSSVGGLGGCPYAEGATGNVSTEDVLFLMKLLDINTGVDIEKVIQIGKEVTEKVNIKSSRTSVKLEDLGNIDMYKKMLI